MREGQGRTDRGEIRVNVSRQTRQTETLTVRWLCSTWSRSLRGWRTPHWQCECSLFLCPRTAIYSERANGKTWSCQNTKREPKWDIYGHYLMWWWTLRLFCVAQCSEDENEICQNEWVIADKSTNITLVTALHYCCCVTTNQRKTNKGHPRKIFSLRDNFLESLNIFRNSIWEWTELWKVAVAYQF